MITNADMTIYNQLPGEDGAVYYRTHLRGVNWQDSKQVVVVANGFATKNVTQVFVPFDVETEKEYCKLMEYRSADKDKHFTLDNGDIAVRGIVEFDLTGEPRKDFKALKHTHNDVMIITSVVTCDIGSREMQHWELEVKA